MKALRCLQFAGGAALLAIYAAALLYSALPLYIGGGAALIFLFLAFCFDHKERRQG